ncbi:uncharacterized protein LOC125033541 isoform X2 [Penaeus chinensis]|uniref:uncharacterized protein LOC125033541 isoform X2 n=1 Tax=Penaeus chinensis TaxID=139456 RepID=UPI001FB6F599|nr:uncharacterized protein LOC125033541 isoform X2 [Penaeus chinensis]
MTLWITRRGHPSSPMMTNVNVAGLYLDQHALQNANDSHNQSYIVFIPLGLGLLLLSVCLRWCMRRGCERKTAVVDPEAAVGDLVIRLFHDPPPDYEDVANDPPPPMYCEVFRDPPDEGIRS